MSDYKVRLSAQDDLTPSLEGIRQQLSKTGQSARNLDEIKKSFDRTISSGSSVQKKLANVKAEMRKMAEAGQQGTELWRKMAEAARGYKQQLDDVDKAIRTTADEQRDLSALLQSGQAGLSGAGSAASGILGLFGGGQATAAIGQLQSAMGSLQGVQSSLGGSASSLINPYVALGAAVVGGTAAWVSYNKEFEATLRRTEQFTGLSGDALVSLRNGIKSVASTWGKDYNDVLASVDGMMAQFGISGEEALGYIRDGFVAGADDAGRMQDLISRYSGSFRDAGISADELVAIIANTRSGIFSEDGMQLIEMAGKNIRLMSTSASESLKQIGIDSEEMTAKLRSGELKTVDALKMISSRLKALPPQSQEVGKVLQDIFGKKGSAAGYQLVTALADVNSNLDEMKQQTGEVGKAQQELQESERRLEDALAAVFAVGNGGFETMTTTIKAKVLGALADLINRFIDLYNNCGAVRGAIAAMGSVLAATWDTIKFFLKIMCDAFIALSDIVQGVFTLDWDKVKNAWNSGIQNILSAAAQYGEEVVEDVQKGIERTEGRIEPIKVPVEPEVSDKVVAAAVSGGDTPTTGGKEKGGKIKTSAPKYDTGSLADYRAQLRALDDELANSASLTDERIRKIDDERMALQKLIKSLEARQRVLRGEKLTKVEANITPAISNKEIFKVNLGEVKKAREDYTDELQKMRAESQAIVDSLRGQPDAMVASFVNLAKILKDQLVTPSEQIAAAMVTLGGAMQQLGADGPVAKAGAVLAAIGQIILGFSTASAQAASLGPFGWLAFTGAGLGAVATMISAIKGYAEGGIIQGSSYHGDRILARVNAGEMILNTRQQGNLFRLLDGARPASGQPVNPKVVIKGSDLHVVWSNYNNKMSKVK